VAAIPYSRAIISISTALLFVSALAEFSFNKPKTNFRNIYFICLAALVLFCMLDGFRAYSVDEWVKGNEVKLPLVIFPFAIVIFRQKINQSFLQLISVVFCVSITISVLASMFNYANNYDEINQLVLQSKNVPIFGGMHHITYSVFGAFATIVAFVLAYQAKLKWMWIPAIINFVGLHILTARTGLVGFYCTGMLLGFVYFINHNSSKKLVLIGIIAAIALPIAAFFTIGSFHNRAVNTWEDVKVIWNQKDANYQSMGMRVEAAKTSFSIIKKHPIIGVGNSNIKTAMAIQYEVNNTNLFIENRILPHNQFIMELTVHGVIGLLLLLVFFIYPLFNGFTKLPLLFISLWSLVLFACMFECLFDRQHGIILVSLFWLLFSNKATEELKEPQNG
jgi:O-antigen ligase